MSRFIQVLLTGLFLSPATTRNTWTVLPGLRAGTHTTKVNKNRLGLSDTNESVETVPLSARFRTATSPHQGSAIYRITS